VDVAVVIRRLSRQPFYSVLWPNILYYAKNAPIYTDQLIVPSHRLSTVGARAFPVAGAYIWNGLPADVTRVCKSGYPLSGYPDLSVNFMAAKNPDISVANPDIRYAVFGVAGFQFH